MSLAEMQRLFWEAIRFPTGVAAFVEQAAPDTREAFRNAFVGTDAFGPVERMNVYADAYYWRLHEALEEMFPVVAWLLGPESLRNLLTDYVLAAPSRDPDLRQFGAPLPTFVAAHPLGAARPHLSALARVEWALVEVLDVLDQPVATAEDLARVPMESWPGMRLCATSSVRLMKSEWSFSGVWKAWRGGLDPGQAPLGQEAGFDLVWRNNLQVFHRRVSSAEGAALHSVVRGAAFEGLCSTAASSGNGPEQVVAWLQTWLADGLVLPLQPQPSSC